MFGETTRHGRAALIGIAVYAGIRKARVSQPCPFCHAEVPPVWEHLVWHCVDPVLAQGRPEPPLDEVLGGRQIAAAPVLRVGTHVPMRACVREVVIFLFVWAMVSCCAARALVGSCWVTEASGHGNPNYCMRSDLGCAASNDIHTLVFVLKVVVKIDLLANYGRTRANYGGLLCAYVLIIIGAEV